MVVARGVARDETDPLISIEISPIEVVIEMPEQPLRRSYWGNFERVAFIFVAQLLLMVLAAVAGEVFSDADPIVIESLQILFGISTLVLAYLLLIGVFDLINPLLNTLSEFHSVRLAVTIKRIAWTVFAIGLGFLTYQSASRTEYTHLEGAWIFEAIVGVGLACICLTYAMPRGILGGIYDRLPVGDRDA